MRCGLAPAHGRAGGIPHAISVLDPSLCPRSQRNPARCHGSAHQPAVCFIPPPPSASLMPEERSCGEQPRLRADPAAPTAALQAHTGCSPPAELPPAPGPPGRGSGNLPLSAQSHCLPWGHPLSDPGYPSSPCPAPHNIPGTFPLRSPGRSAGVCPPRSPPAAHPAAAHRSSSAAFLAQHL